MHDTPAGIGRLGGLLREAVVVVVSILLALALDAWWDNRQLERDVREELSGLEGELAANLHVIDEQLAIMEHVVTSSEHLLAVLADDPTAELVSVRDTIAVRAFVQSPTLQLSSGGVQALLTSGRLPAISSAELRLGIAGLSEMVDDAREGQLVARDISNEQLAPLIYDRVDTDFYRIVAAQDTWSPGQALPSFESISFPNSRPIRQFLRARRGWLRGAMQDMRALRTRVDSLQLMIRTELGTTP